MLVKATDEYKNDLFSLWKEAFGDEDGYINIFFNTVYKENIRVFAEFDSGKIVSALYLMPSYISDNGALYNGYYLYAAATLKTHRGRGLMERLINEAKNYVASEKKDYISLVPGEEYLYSYYKKFGFEPVMYRCSDVIGCDCLAAVSEELRISFDAYFEIRKKEKSVSAHHLCTEAYRYASECFEYLGLTAYACDDTAFIFDGECNCIRELISGKEADFVKALLPVGEYTVYSADGDKKEPFGMVWFADGKEKISDIYMNIALD